MKLCETLTNKFTSGKSIGGKKLGQLTKKYLVEKVNFCTKIPSNNVIQRRKLFKVVHEKAGKI